MEARIRKAIKIGDDYVPVDKIAFFTMYEWQDSTDYKIGVDFSFHSCGIEGASHEEKFYVFDFLYEITKKGMSLEEKKDFYLTIWKGKYGLWMKLKKRFEECLLEHILFPGKSMQEIKEQRFAGSHSTELILIDSWFELGSMFYSGLHQVLKDAGFLKD